MRIEGGGVAAGLTVQARDRSQVSPCEICGRQSGTSTFFLLGVSIFVLSVSVRHCSILIFIYLLLLPKRRMCLDWGPFRKQRCFGNLGSFDREVLSEGWKMECIWPRPLPNRVQFVIRQLRSFRSSLVTSLY